MSTSEQAATSTRPYAIVFAALLVLLGITVALAFADLGHSLGVIVAISIASVKALLIILYFMHVRGEPWRVRMFATAGFVWLAILVTLIFADYATRKSPLIQIKGEPRLLPDVPPSVSSSPLNFTMGD